MSKAGTTVRAVVVLIPSFFLSVNVVVAELPGEGPRLEAPPFTQQQILDGDASFRDIRAHGLRVFTTPFNKADGYGDGPMNPADPITPGGRPTLQGNGAFLRVNGLDGQTCFECHTIVSNAEIPARLGIGGVGGAVANAMFMPNLIDVADGAGAGIASFNGRFINPLFLFGSGGVELLGKEMTTELQALKAQAEATPGVDVPLLTKGVSFGVIRYENGVLDVSSVEGIDDDLVVRPFGRKGEFPTVRAFDVGAMQFHFGMQPLEAFGAGVDDDGDGVLDELLVEDLSALSVFLTSLERPRQRYGGPGIIAGFLRFQGIGCTDCHIPALNTDSRYLTYSFPEIIENPSANVFYSVDLAKRPARFNRSTTGGVRVPLFADLKRHDMGPQLAESFGSTLDSQFTTARLWGVADTAPYMHDGRAMTLNEAILMHGGEAQTQRDAYAAMPEKDQADLLRFLRSLRTPQNPAADLLR